MEKNESGNNINPHLSSYSNHITHNNHNLSCGDTTNNTPINNWKHKKKDTYQGTTTANDSGQIPVLIKRNRNTQNSTQQSIINDKTKHRKQITRENADTFHLSLQLNK